MRSSFRVALAAGLALGAGAVAGAQEEGLPLPTPSEYGRRLNDRRSPDTTPTPATLSPTRAPAPRTPAPAPQAPETSREGTRGARGALLGEEPGTVLVNQRKRLRSPTLRSPRPEDVKDRLQPGDELIVLAMQHGRYEFLGFSDATHTGLRVRRGGAQFTLPLRNIRELTVVRYVNETVRRPSPPRTRYVPPAAGSSTTASGPSHTIFHPDDPRQRAFPAIPASDSPRGEFTQEVRIGGRPYYVVPGSGDWLNQLGSDAVARENDRPE